MAVVERYLGCLFVMKAGVRVYLWCQISKGKTKITPGSLNEAIITLLYLQKGATSGVIALRFFFFSCGCCMRLHTHLNITKHDMHVLCHVLRCTLCSCHISTVRYFVPNCISSLITKWLICLKVMQDVALTSLPTTRPLQRR